MMKKFTIIKVVFLALVMLLVNNLSAQEQANIWYFGENAGVSFSTGDPVALLDGVLNTWEGCSSICTSTGALRFYTDGIEVYQRNHVRMPNGYGLLGDPSSSQSGVIIPKPGSTQLFYIFTIDDVDVNGGTNGLNYTLVDMTVNNFMGDVITTEKNIRLVSPLCEKVTAVGHSNGVDIWVITQKWGTNDFYVFKITTAGVNTEPIISSVGQVIGGDGVDIDVAKGYMKVSPDGKKIAKGNAGLRNLEIFDFNNTTGVVSNVIMDPALGGEPYGIEFSPNGNYLYVQTWKNNPGRALYQYDLKAGSPADIIASRYLVAGGLNGALQLAPDNRIYIANAQTGYLSRINEPNKPGAQCNFQASAVYLEGRNSMWGLPPFIQSFFSFNAGFFNDPPCYGTPTQFFENSSSEPDSVFWDFGNPASGADNYSTEFDPVHLYTGSGFYPVKLTVWISGQSDLASKTLNVTIPPDPNLGPDSFLCEGDDYILDAGPGYDSYFWSTLQTTQSITVQSAGTYWVRVQNGGCMGSDTIYLNAYEKPNVNLGPDQEQCEGTLIELDAGSGFEHYLWSTGDTTQTLVVQTTDDYWVEVTNSLGCPNRDTVLVSFFPKPIANAGPNQTIDQGFTTVLEGSATSGTGNYSFHWEPANMLEQNNIPNPTTKPIITPTIFTLTVTDDLNCISSSDQVLINLTGSSLAAFPFAEPSLFCAGEATYVTSNVTGGGGEYTYSWTSNPPGFTSDQESFTDYPIVNTTYNLEVKDQYNNTFPASVNVEVIQTPPVNLIPDGFVPIAPDTIAVCVRDSVWLDAGLDSDPPTTTYYWTKANTLGRYYLATTNGNWFDIQTHDVQVNYGGETECESFGRVTIFFDFNQCGIGIDETPVNDKAIGLFPNPNNGKFTLVMNEEINDLQVKVFDMKGSLLFEDFLAGKFVNGYTKEFDLKLKDKGIFIVHLGTSDFHLVKKMIVN